MAHEHLVLVVDDEPHTRDIFADVLRQSGAGVAVAEDGEAALAIVRAGLRPCVVLTDVRMPRMDGWALDRALRDVAPDVRVALVTSDRLLSVTASVSPKPVGQAEIEGIIRATCHAAEERRPA